VAVYEAGPQVGGLARSFDLWGHRVDLGPHRFFSTDARVNRLWLDLVGDQYDMVERLTRIYYAGHFFRYPLRPLEVARNLGPARAVRCLASYLGEQLRLPNSNADEASFETWVVRRFGRRLFETFFKSYSEKLWGIPCSELSADFAAQRIKKFSLGEALASAILPRRARGHRTLTDRFAYPRGGTGSVYETMAERIRGRGGEVHLQSPVRRVVVADGAVRGVELASGQFEPADHVVSTMPLTLLVQGLSNVPGEVTAAAESLRFRNTLLVYLHVAGGNLFRDQWLYIHAPELAMGRVTNFNNWGSAGDRQTTILAAEFWCDDNDATWNQNDAQLIERATRELRETGLLGASAVLGGHVERVRRCYPVYRRGYRQQVAVLADYLRTLRNLTAIGRYGAFKYNNQDHSILMGILAAENLLEARNHDLWSVNADYDAYHEHAVITEQGLTASEALAGT
jgi:protoporphyrinogen oxidase